MEFFRFDLSSCNNRVLAVKDKKLLEKACPDHDRRADSVLAYLYMDLKAGYRLIICGTCRLNPFTRFYDDFTHQMISYDMVKYDQAALPERELVRLDRQSEILVERQKKNMLGYLLRHLACHGVEGWSIKRTGD